MNALQAGPIPATARAVHRAHGDCGQRTVSAKGERRRDAHDSGRWRVCISGGVVHSRHKIAALGRTSIQTQEAHPMWLLFASPMQGPTPNNPYVFQFCCFEPMLGLIIYSRLHRLANLDKVTPATAILSTEYSVLSTDQCVEKA